MIKEYKDSTGNLIALKVDFRKKFLKDFGFLTAPDLPFQLGFRCSKKFKHLPFHIHIAYKREISNTSEFIFVLEGKLIIKLYDENAVFVDIVELSEKQALLQFKGGHAFDIAPNTCFFELKQGPYLGKDKDKKLIGDKNDSC